MCFVLTLGPVSSAEHSPHLGPSHDGSSDSKDSNSGGGGGGGGGPSRSSNDGDIVGDDAGEFDGHSSEYSTRSFSFGASSAAEAELLSQNIQILPCLENNDLSQMVLLEIMCNSFRLQSEKRVS